MKQYFSFQWHITDQCDQRCKHCYIFSGGEHQHLDSMTWAQMEDTFYNCLDFCAVYDRLPYFYITGDYAGFCATHDIKVPTGGVCIFTASPGEPWQCSEWGVKAFKNIS